MRGFVQWLDEVGFYVDNVWDFESGRWLDEPGKLQLAEHQRRILSKALTPVEQQFPWRTVVISAPKKSGKTALLAAIMAWYADEVRARSEIYSMAGNKEQASARAFSDLSFHYEQTNPEVVQIADQMTLPNGTIIKAQAMAHRTVAGSRHGLTAWDELWNYVGEPARRTWVEMTPIPTVAYSLRVIVTYAGYEGESELLWDLYKNNVGPEEHESGKGTKVEGLEDLPVWERGSTFVYWDHEGRMPWQTPEYYEEQFNDPSMRASDFIRLHQNNWVTSHEVFIPIEWWDEAASKFEKSAELWPQHPYRDFPVYVGVDAAVKRDCTAVVGVTFDREKGKLILLFHKIWTPRDDEEFDLERTVENYVLKMYNKFRINYVDYDPMHMHQAQLRLSAKGVPMFQFTQTADNMTKASQVLYDLLKTKSVEAYPDSELRAHIQFAHAQTRGRGFRLVKDPGKRKFKIDGAIALAMAAWRAVTVGGVDVSKPIRVEMPFSDVSGWEHKDPSQIELPFALRD